MNLIQCPCCKVRYKENAVACPICLKARDGTEVKHDANAHTTPVRVHWKRALLIIVFMLLFIPCIVVLSSDHIHANTFTWSPLVVVAVLFAYAYFCCLIALYKHRISLFLSLICTTLVFLFTLNTIMHTRWFASIALPITLLWVVLGYMAFIVITKPTTRGFAIVGILLFFIALALLGMDLVITYEIHKTLSLGWSVICAGAIIPLAVVMIYVQKYKNAIDKWIHL